jgi:hypothetical protein
MTLVSPIVKQYPVAKITMLAVDAPIPNAAK